MLVANLCSLLVYFIITQPLPTSWQIVYKTWVTRHLSINNDIDNSMLPTNYQSRQMPPPSNPLPINLHGSYIPIYWRIIIMNIIKTWKGGRPNRRPSKKLSVHFWTLISVTTSISTCRGASPAHIYSQCVVTTLVGYTMECEQWLQLLLPLMNSINTNLIVPMYCIYRLAIITHTHAHTHTHDMQVRKLGFGCYEQWQPSIQTQKKLDQSFTKMEYPCPHIKGHSVLMGRNDSCMPETTPIIVNTRTIVVADSR